MKIYISVIIISDRAASGNRADETIPIIKQWCLDNSFEIFSEYIVSDEKIEIAQALKKALAEKKTKLIITSGGTGFAARDNTPEVTGEFVEKFTPGIDEYLRMNSLKVTPFAALSRGISGIAKSKLIINLPGNPNAVLENLQWLEKILSHGIKLLSQNVDDSEHSFS